MGNLGGPLVFLPVARKRALVRGRDLAPINCQTPLGERAIFREGTGSVASPYIESLAPD
jgi:hypothetical protein